MARVFDFSPSDHEVVVSRILMHLHHAVDESFPLARPASPRFAKTSFVGYDEPTLTQQMPHEQREDHFEIKPPSRPLPLDLIEDDEGADADVPHDFNGTTLDYRRRMKPVAIGLAVIAILAAILGYLSAY